MNFDSYDDFMRACKHTQMVNRLKVPYRGGDIYTDNRHRFVRKLQRPQWLSGPFTGKPSRASPFRSCSWNRRQKCDFS